MKKTAIFGGVFLLLLGMGLGFWHQPKPEDWPEPLQRIENEFPEVDHVKPTALHDLMQKGSELVVLLDTRSQSEYQVSHLQGALLAETFEDALAKLKFYGKEVRVVPYCSVGYRSSNMAQKLKAQGYTQIQNLEGGIFGWANHKFPVYQGKQRVHQVHPFDEKWGAYLDQAYKRK